MCKCTKSYEVISLIDPYCVVAFKGISLSAWEAGRRAPSTGGGRAAEARGGRGNYIPHPAFGHLFPRGEGRDESLVGFFGTSIGRVVHVLVETSPGFGSLPVSPTSELF
jgi:hypothetical protein